MKIHPGPAVAVRFFVQYNVLNKVPRLRAIRLNGREICNADHPQPAVERPDVTSLSNQDNRPNSRPETRPTSQPSQSRPNQSRPTESRPNQRQTERPNQRPVETQTRPSIAIRPEDKPQTKPVYGRPSGDGPVYVPTSNPPIEQSNVNPYSM